MEGSKEENATMPSLHPVILHHIGVHKRDFTAFVTLRRQNAVSKAAKQISDADLKAEQDARRAEIRRNYRDTSG